MRSHFYGKEAVVAEDFLLFEDQLRIRAISLRFFFWGVWRVDAA
jgi:hypothetical protein